MKGVILLIVAIILAILVVLNTRAADISVCRDTSVEWFRYRFTGIDWSLDTLFYVADGASAEGDTLIADALVKDNGDGLVFKDEALLGYYLGDGEWFLLKGTSGTLACGDGDPNVWHPGAPSIDIPMTSDCAHVEIVDDYGHWSTVTSNGEPVLLHYGEALIGSNNQSINPDDYRAVETACY